MTRYLWYVIWYPECKGWAVMKDQFRDSWYKDKKDAETQRDKLNSKEGLK